MLKSNGCHYISPANPHHIGKIFMVLGFFLFAAFCACNSEKFQQAEVKKAEDPKVEPKKKAAKKNTNTNEEEPEEEIAAASGDPDDEVGLESKNTNSNESPEPVIETTRTNETINLKSCMINLDPKASANFPRVPGEDTKFLLNNTCNIETENSATAKRPVDIFFLLDISASMDASIDAIKMNISAFITKISDQNPRIALIPFVDEVYESGVVNLTADTSLFTNTLTPIEAGATAGNGGGWSEAGLVAINRTIQLIRTDMTANPDRASAAKVILMITDVASHNGDKDVQDTTSTVAALNALVGEVEEFRFMYSASNGRGDANPIEDSDYWLGDDKRADLQYAGILNTINTEVALDQRGGSLAYPFNQDALLTGFFEKLSSITSVVKATIPCYMTSATLELIGSTDWVPYPLKDVTIDAGITIGAGESKVFEAGFLTSVLMRTQHEAFQIKVNRCCGADIGPLKSGTCEKTMSQTLPFDLIMATE